MRLTVETGPNAGTQLTLERDHPVTLGSDADCELRLADPAAAPRHAVVKALRDEGFGVKALAPGLRLNGSEIEAAPLRNGDVLEVGTTRVVYGVVAPAKGHGPQIPGFKVLDELGRGGNGVVWRAEQVSLHREVALKVLDRRFTDDPQFVARFVAEARAAAKLGHPNVVHVLDVGQDGSTYYYAMELMHHGSLEAWLKKNGRMPVEQALQVIADAAAGLAYAESHGIVHRDIKPDNLMLDQHGTAKIADLGLAFTEDDTEDHVAGTPHFMAPEQALRKGVDQRSDLYSLGCTFYRLVTGRTPFRGQTVKDILRAHVRDAAEPANKVESSVPAEVAAIIQKLMEKEPAARFQSATELLEAVNTLLQPPARKGLWIGLAAAAVVIAGGAIYWAVTKPKEVVEVERKYDDPEKQLFADQLVELRAQQKEDHATIALLRARLTGGSGLELAAALDAVVAAHDGTTAAAEAGQLAAAARAAVERERAAAQRAREQAEAALQELRSAVDAAVKAGQLPRAWSLVQAAAPPADADAAVYAAGRAAARQSVLDAARAHTGDLGSRIDAALAQKDLKTARELAASLQQIAAADGGWPDELLGDRQSLLQRATATARSADDLAAARTAERWRTYASFVHGDAGALAMVRRADFAAAENRLGGVASELPDSPMAQRAARLQASLHQAGRFADALAERIGSGEVTLTLPGSEATTVTVTAWNRPGGTLTVADPNKKPVKPFDVSVTDLDFGQWESLAQQAQEGQLGPGSRACFLGFLCLGADLDAARRYLQELRPDDDSGTGDRGYAGNPNRLEQLLQQLPPGAEWCTGIRDELAAGQLLAAGLRALSERRNRAAAAHVDRALQEYAHSISVSGLQ